MNANALSLDLFSTSQTNGAFPFGKSCAVSDICSYNAPYFAFNREGKIYGVCQGSCNHWDCSRCGILRAKHEYGRIVVGCQSLAEKHKLYFITITCKGRELSVETAEKDYLLWTNRLLSTLRITAKRKGIDWNYVQVTEKQKRGHPHSHILTTFCPCDLYLGHKFTWETNQQGRQHIREIALRSDWLLSALLSAGLGDQYDISIVSSAAAASRYVAKYMFKDSMFGTHWPKGWKRVRYSQNFPKLPERETNAFVLLSKMDWQKLAGLAAVVTTDSAKTKTEVLYQLSGHDVLVS